MPFNIQAQGEKEAEAMKSRDGELKAFIEREADDHDLKILDRALKEFSAMHSGRRPEEPPELTPFLKTSAEKAAYGRLIQRNKESEP